MCNVFEFSLARRNGTAVVCDPFSRGHQLREDGIKKVRHHGECRIINDDGQSLQTSSKSRKPSLITGRENMLGLGSLLLGEQGTMFISAPATRENKIDIGGIVVCNLNSECRTVEYPTEIDEKWLSEGNNMSGISRLQQLQIQAGRCIAEL